MSSIHLTIPLVPMATPRPEFSMLGGSGKTKVIAYYPDRYKQYLDEINAFFKDNSGYGANFKSLIDSDGIIADINFYVPVASTTRIVTKIMRTTAPDIDNLLKGVMDGIFNKNPYGVRDSRIVGVRMLKFNELDYPRLDIRLATIDDLAKLPANQAFNSYEPTSQWSVSIPYSPVAASRPQYRKLDKPILKDGSIRRGYSYHTKAYSQYLRDINSYLTDNKLYNSDFQKVIGSPEGIIADFNFYCAGQKHQKKIQTIMRQTAPDIDNLLKGAMDGIFNDNPFGVKDSRVVGVRMLKFNELDDPRTEVKLVGI